MKKILSYFACAAIMFSFAACGGKDGNVPEEVYDAPEGAIHGLFSVGTGQVYFSKGNLQATYDGSEWTWSFAENQWDFIGASVANTAINADGTVAANKSVDLFGWSTPNNYYGINRKVGYESCYLGNFVEWGNNKISNGGNEANRWRTLTSAEWWYLLNSRTNAANLRGKATLNGKKGYIFLPDGANPAALGFTPSSNWNSNEYNSESESWKAMQRAGAVFLPTAGQRGALIQGGECTVNLVDKYGYYWSATLVSDNAYASFAFSFGIYGSDNVKNYDRYYGQSVRLVQNVE